MVESVGSRNRVVVFLTTRPRISDVTQKLVKGPEITSSESFACLLALSVDVLQSGVFQAPFKLSPKVIQVRRTV